MNLETIPISKCTPEVVEVAPGLFDDACQLSLSSGSSSGRGILLRPSISVPIEIYTEERIAEFASDEEELAKLYPPHENA